MDTVKSQLEMLIEDSQGNVNYESWRFKLNLTLKSRKIYDAATGITLRPDGAEDNATVAAWIVKDLEAQTLIGLNCSSSIAKKISKCTSAYGMLSKLDTLYGKKSDVSVEGLQRQFFGYKYNDKKTAIENCIQIQEYADSLSAEGEEIKESWIMQRILGILPPKLHHFRTAWDNVSATERTLSNLFDRLRLEEDRLNESESGSKQTPQNAFISKQGNKSMRSLDQKGNSIECFKCGKRGHTKAHCQGKPCAKYIEYCKNTYGCKICKNKGHFAKECPNKDSSQCENKSDKNNSQNGGTRRAFISVSLSAASFETASSVDFYNNWYQDCAATQHMSSHKSWFKNYVELEEPSKVMIGDATELEGIGVGEIELEAFNGQTWNKIVLQDVLYTPKMPFNLVSVSTILDRGYKQEADAGMSIFKDSDGNVGARAVREGKLFKMEFRLESFEKCLMTVSIKKWHEKLAHQNIGYVRDILKKNKIRFVDDWDNYVCPGCCYGKQHRVSHPLNVKVASQPLDLIHVDLCEMDIHSLGGAKYFLLFKDDYSHFRTVYYLKNKSEAPAKLEVFMKLVENQFNRRVKVLRSDNGTEIKNRETKQLLENLGVFHSLSSAYTPQQNGRVEREMRTIVEAARSAVHARNLDESLWAEAVNYVVFTLNQTGTSSVKGKSPADLWFGRRIDINKLRIFGCDCYVLIEDHKRGKIEKKSEKGIFVGYDIDSPGFRVYVSNNNDVISSSNVLFDEQTETENFTDLEILSTEKEEKIRESKDSEDEDSEYTSFDTERSQDESQSDESELDANLENIEVPENQDNENLSNDLEHEKEDSQVETPVVRSLRDRRKIKPPSKLKDYVTDSVFITQSIESNMIGEVKDISVPEALKDKSWKNAMIDEFESLTRMKTWILVEKPKNVRPLTCRWVLSIKGDGQRKARVVIRGFEQEEGKNYFATFSPVAHHMSIRLILSIAASENMKVMTFDVKTAFLHGELKEEIFMYQPEGFNDKSGRVCKLQKSLYGLKQAPKNWNQKFTGFLKSLNFESTDDDPCVYYNKDRSLIIALHVDDGLMAGKSESYMIEILRKLNKEFQITYNNGKGKVLSYLGMEIQLRQTGIFISQSKYAERIVHRFKLDEVNPVYTPIERGMVTDSEHLVNDKTLEKSEPYREAVGSLLYLATISRPDISFAVNYLSRFNNKPMLSHWKMIKRVFQYVKGTMKFGIFFDGKRKLIGYSDSDHGGDLDTMCSTSGVLLLRGGPIVWFTQKQHTVANSTAEAEYRAAISAIDDISWIRRLANELEHLDINKPTTLYVDNQSAIHMLQNTLEGKITKGKKHVEISRKFIQQHIGSTIEPQHVKSEDQLADILTKPLLRKVFERLRCKIIKEEC